MCGSGLIFSTWAHINHHPIMRSTAWNSRNEWFFRGHRFVLFTLLGLSVPLFFLFSIFSSALQRLLFFCLSYFEAGGYASAPAVRRLRRFNSSQLRASSYQKLTHLFISNVSPPTIRRLNMVTVIIVKCTIAYPWYRERRREREMSFQTEKETVMQKVYRDYQPPHSSAGFR